MKYWIQTWKNKTKDNMQDIAPTIDAISSQDMQKKKMYTVMYGRLRSKCRIAGHCSELHGAAHERPGPVNILRPKPQVA